MHQQRQARPGHVWQRRAQLLLRNHGETIDSGIDQKAFETRHSGGCESFDVVLVIVNDSAPGRPIDAAFAVCGRTLGLERSNRRGRGKTVQRHINEHRVSARGRGSGRGFEAFPLGAPGLVDMHVRIDEPGKNGRIAEVMNFVAHPVLDPEKRRPGFARPPQGWPPGRIPSGVTTRRETKACKLKMSAPEYSAFQQCESVARFFATGNSILRNSESSLYSLLSEAAAKESMSTDLRVRGLLAPANP